MRQCIPGSRRLEKREIIACRAHGYSPEEFVIPVKVARRHSRESGNPIWPADPRPRGDEGGDFHPPQAHKCGVERYVIPTKGGNLAAGPPLAQG
jgi:hypothetical protein